MRVSKERRLIPNNRNSFTSFRICQRLVCRGDNRVAEDRASLMVCWSLRTYWFRAFWRKTGFRFFSEAAPAKPGIVGEPTQPCFSGGRTRARRRSGTRPAGDGPAVLESVAYRAREEHRRGAGAGVRHARIRDRADSADQVEKEPHRQDCPHRDGYRGQTAIVGQIGAVEFRLFADPFHHGLHHLFLLSPAGSAPL